MYELVRSYAERIRLSRIMHSYYDVDYSLVVVLLYLLLQLVVLYTNK